MYTKAEDAVKLIKPGNRVFIHGGAATPHYMLKEVAKRSKELWNVELVSISLQGDAILTDKKYRDSFRTPALKAPNWTASRSWLTPY